MRPTVRQSADETRVERALTLGLRIGIITSLFLIVTGMLLSALHHPKLLLSQAEFSRLVAPGAAFPHVLSDVARGFASLHGQAVTTTGILILLLLPVLRVVTAGILFFIQRDRMFVAITMGVITLLLFSLILGHT